MKLTVVSAIAAASILLTGCGKQDGASDGSSPAAKPSADTASTSTPAAQPTLTAWQDGDHARAINSFLEADWTARPLFASGSPLNLSEAQFKALSNADRQVKSTEMLAQINSLKQLASAVAQAGREAAAKGDTAQARKYFASLKQCGTAFDSAENLSVLQLVGQAFKKMADAELLYNDHA